MKIVCKTVNVKDSDCAVEEYLKTKNLSYKIVPYAGRLEYDITLPQSYSLGSVQTQFIRAHLQTLCEQCKAENVQYQQRTQEKLQKVRG